MYVCVFFFHLFTVNIKKKLALGSRSSSLWNKQYNSILLIHRDSLILPNTVLGELFHNSVFINVSLRAGCSDFSQGKKEG